jgi:hypothetical protein
VTYPWDRDEGTEIRVADYSSTGPLIKRRIYQLSLVLPVATDRGQKRLLMVTIEEMVVNQEM